jgi:hypothetical protein
MTKQPIISRRLLLAGLWLFGTRSAWTQVRNGEDRGIGGTGIAYRHDDRGIGGTGFLGVIQRFGSIFVNGERIGYAPNVPVMIDGVQTSAKALRVGQVVRVLALRHADGTLTTRGIKVSSEVVGPIENVEPGEITVLGQRVLSAGSEGWRRPGVHVAVFGLRRTDGVIVASLVEPHRGNAMRIAGLLVRDGGELLIGHLRLDGVNPELVGRRVQAELRIAQGGVMQVSHVKEDDFSDLAGAQNLSIEAYVRRTGSDLQFGSGHVARDISRFQPSAGEARVIVDAVLDGINGLRVESVRLLSNFPGGSMQGPHRPDLDPGAAPRQGTAPGPSGLPSGLGQPGGPGQTIGPGSPSPGPGSFGLPGGSPGGPGGPGGFGGGGGRR